MCVFIWLYEIIEYIWNVHNMGIFDSVQALTDTTAPLNKINEYDVSNWQSNALLCSHLRSYSNDKENDEVEPSSWQKRKFHLTKTRSKF